MGKKKNAQDDLLSQMLNDVDEVPEASKKPANKGKSKAPEAQNDDVDHENDAGSRGKAPTNKKNQKNKGRQDETDEKPVDAPSNADSEDEFVSAKPKKSQQAAAKNASKQQPATRKKSAEESDSESEEERISAISKNQKIVSKKKSESGSDDDDGSAESEGEEGAGIVAALSAKPAQSKPASKAGKSSMFSAFSMLDHGDDDDAEKEEEEEDSEEEEEEAKVDSKKPQKKKQPVPSVKKDAPKKEAQPAKEQTAPKTQTEKAKDDKNKGKKKGNDFDDVLEDILGPGASEKTAEEDKKKRKRGPKAKTDAANELDAAGQEPSAATISASAAVLPTQGADVSEEKKEDPGAKKEDKKKDTKKKEEPAKKPSAAASKILEMKRKQLEEIERLKREEEERVRKEEEEERRRVEEAERKEAEKKRKAEERAAKREQLRKEGKLLTEGQKKKRALELIRLEQMKKMGLIPADAQLPGSAHDESDDENESKAQSATQAPVPSQSSAEEKKKKEDKKLPHQPKKPKKEDVIAKLEAEQKERDRLLAIERENREKAKEEERLRKERESLENAVRERMGAMSLDAQKDEVVEEEEEVEDWEQLADSDVEDDAEHEPDSKGSDNSWEVVDEDPAPVVQQQPVKPSGAPVPKQKESEAAAESQTAADTTSAVSATSSKKEKPKTLRSPIAVILGHVDVGKTKLLDKIRGTNVQDNEAGGITQQIGATYFPLANLMQRISRVQGADRLMKEVPGLLVIDTPGHESFSNLRSRGSSLCDIAVVVVDLMHGLEPQTRESIELLRSRKTPFVIALNKVDRLYGWNAIPDGAIRESLDRNKDGEHEFNERLRFVQTQFAELSINTHLYWKNPNFLQNVSIVPTSAHTGEGIPDLLMLILQLTQRHMAERLLYLSNKLECTVLEVKIIEGLGTTIDVILVNGTLREGDRIVVCGLSGPIVTTIRALLTPKPMREIRVRGEYVHHKELEAAQGIKISAPGLEDAVAGSALMVVKNDAELEAASNQVMEDLQTLLSKLDRTGKGVYVQASTLGSLEALMSFLKDSKIPVSAIGLGSVYKKDVMRASIMLESAREYAVILAFDVKITAEAQTMADEVGVRIFSADIIYHLFDMFTKYIGELKEIRNKELSESVIWPCRFKILPNCVFNSTEPIVVGVEVLDCVLKPNTPVAIPQADGTLIDLGKVLSIEKEGKPVDSAKKGDQVAIKIVARNPTQSTKFLDKKKSPFVNVDIYAHLTRKSIDALKELHKNDLTKEEWMFVVRAKTILKVE
nr:translation initiation factor IF-2 [Andalucia godoyi]|eukprot:ANDGO_00550.mRNA.1 Eukaryotic translation initiation factor 5B